MKRKIKLLTYALATAMLLTACGSSSSSSTTSSSSSSTETTASSASSSENTDVSVYEGEKIYQGWTTSMATFNPHMYTNSKSFYNYGHFVSLMVSNDGSEKLEFVPYHTSELPKSDDGGLTWTLKIREDLAWSDGTPIDANTYEYSMRMLLDPLLVNKNAAYMFDTSVVLNAREYYQGDNSWEEVGVKVLDDYTLEITLQYPATELDFYTSICSVIWPVHEEMYEQYMNADRTSTTYGTTLESTPSCGVYTLVEWITDGKDSFRTNYDDPLVKLGYINLDGIDRRYISDNATRKSLFFSGELDNHSLTGDDYLTYRNDPRAYPFLSSNVWGYFLNGASSNPIMQIQDFRQALYYASPREEIAADVFKLYPAAPYLISTGIYVGDPISGGELYRDTDAAKALLDTYHTDYDKAVELFNSAYEQNGSVPVSIEYIYFDGQEDQKRQAEIMQEHFEGLFGADRFTLELRAMPAASAYDVYRAGEYDMGLGVRLANVFNPWSTLNVWTQDYPDKYITGFANDEFDQLQHESVYGSLVNDTEGKVEALARMEEILLEYAAFVPMFQNDNTVMYAERIEVPSSTYLPWVGYGANQADIVQ